MKKMTGFILLGMLIILFAACGGSGGGSSDEGNNSTPTTTVSSTSSSTSTSTSSSSSTSGTTTTTVDNLPATGIDVSWVPYTPDKPGTFCTLTKRIDATIVASDADGETAVTWAWYDRSDTGIYLNPVSSGSATITEANGTVTTSLTQRFGYHHHIKLVVSADDVVTDQVEALIA